MENKVQYTLSLKDLFSNKLKTALGTTEKLDKNVNRLKGSFSSLGSALGIGISTAGVVAFGGAVVESLKNYEYFSASLRTLMKGDAGAAKALERQLVTLAAKTPFSLVEVQDATKQLLAYGFSAKDVTKNINMLGDVASALKIPFGDIAYLYGTLKTQGRAFSKDIYQFTGRGIPIVAELAKQFGVAESEVMNLVSSGKVGFGEIEKAFKSMTGEGGMFFKMMDEQSKTVGGRISNLGDNWEQLKVNIGKSQKGIIASTVSFVNDMVQAMTFRTDLNNSLEEAFSKYGAKQLGSFEYRTEKDRIRGQFAFLKNFTQRSASDKELAKADLRTLTYQLKNLNKNVLGETEYNRQSAMLQSAIESIGNNLKLIEMPSTKTGGATDLSKAGTSTGGSTNIEARQPINFNIDINKLVEKIEITQNNIKDSAATIKEEVTKALIEAVNDFQMVASK